MPRGYRSIILAIVAGLILGAADRQQRNQEQARSQQEVAQSLSRIAGALDNANEPKRESADCPKGRDDRKSDLCAQWKAADAAEQGVAASIRANGIARGANYIGIIGLVLGAVTMAAAIAAAKFAKDAADHTERGANAAESAIAETQRIGEAQVRAYLTFEKMGGQRMPDGLVFKAVIKNSGQSPALCAQILIKIIDKDGKPIEILPDIEHDIPAQATADMAYCYYFNKEAPSWETVVVIAKISYADVFGRIHGIEERFASIPTKWEDDDFTDLANGRDVASYMGAVGLRWREETTK